MGREQRVHVVQQQAQRAACGRERAAVAPQVCVNRGRPQRASDLTHQLAPRVDDVILEGAAGSERGVRRGGGEQVAQRGGEVGERVPGVGRQAPAGDLAAAQAGAGRGDVAHLWGAGKEEGQREGWATACGCRKRGIVG